MIAGGGTAQRPDPIVGDVEVARALMARLYREHETGDWMRCHATALEVTEHLRLVRIIVPQHNLWTVNPHLRCDSVHVLQRLRPGRRLRADR